MESYTRYWVATMVRGVIALVAGLAVLVLPQMVSLVFLLPFAVLLSMLCLAVYGVVDSLLLFITSFLLPHHQAGRFALRTQGLLGAICGALLFAFVYDRAQLAWFLYLAALQAASIAITEFIVAKGTSVHHGSRWCFLSAVVAALSAIGLLFGRNLLPENIAWLLFAYLGILGFTLTLLSARMLFAERHTRRTAAFIKLPIGSHGAPIAV